MPGGTKTLPGEAQHRVDKALSLPRLLFGAILFSDKVKERLQARTLSRDTKRLK
jgi:hypothetical protein